MQAMQEEYFDTDAEADKGASNAKAFLVSGFQLVAGCDPVKYGRRLLLRSVLHSMK